MAGQAPDFLTVEETARVLRIRRTAAYQLVKHDLETAGSDGLRARRFGRLIRVPRSAVEQLSGGPIAWPLDGESFDQPAELPAETTRSTTRRNSRPQRERAHRDDSQTSLPFTG